jgi:hypothetical protein
MLILEGLKPPSHITEEAMYGVIVGSRAIGNTMVGELQHVTQRKPKPCKQGISAPAKLFLTTFALPSAVC